MIRCACIPIKGFKRVLEEGNITEGYNVNHFKSYYFVKHRLHVRHLALILYFTVCKSPELTKKLASMNTQLLVTLLVLLWIFSENDLALMLDLIDTYFFFFC